MKASNIVLSIRTEAAPFADKPAVIEGERRLTYGALLSASAEAAATLASHGVTRFNRVAFHCDDSIEYIVLSLAVLELGAVVVPLSASLASDEAEDIIRRIDVEFVLFDTELSSDPGVALRVGHWCGRSFRIRGRAPQAPHPEGYTALNPAFIRFSSGTTGTSKGILLSHEAILERTTAANEGLQVTHEDVVLWVLSMSFHFVVSILLFLRRAATIVLCHKPFPAALLEGLRTHRGTFIYASPFHYHMLTASAAVDPEALSGIRMAVSTAMNLPSETAAAFRGKFGFELTGAYGIIEVGLPFVDTLKDPAKRGSVGRILPAYTCRIAEPDESGTGRILLKGRGMFDAYFSPWQPRTDCQLDGWFDTGDLGRMDADGVLFIVGREKNVINFAGMKVFPYEVETVINQHPDVTESLLYATPHPVYGQLPIAKVVPAPGVEREQLELSLKRYCYRHLAPYKVPKAFEIVGKLERTASNKLVRTQP